MFVSKLKQAIQDEYQAYFFYKSLHDQLKEPMWKDFVRHAYEDEKSHYEMFQQLHYMLTGEYVPNPKRPIPCYDAKQCVQKALADELEDIETYKEMLLTIPIQEAYNPLFIAMHDEMEHAIRMSVIYHALS
ncbi:ferritin-like domain-containing protein [Sporosarcina aquimarina]|uniref:Ferritin-like domain-containing protein n=1 Tax=Sporosarcina aquimarina TaxID=114975 RepID=A0ABU4G280_9BACL|nr:ferritin-like domain-containing protein [Sporosarcina aquimarina]MDW0111061.1 ferritin-like domain-containing protein [Sporosarcina aquimarina]